MKNSCFFLIAVFTLINCSLSQNNSSDSGNNIAVKMDVKAGIDLFSFSNKGLSIHPSSKLDFWGSFTYSFTKNLQFEIIYRYTPGLTYNYLYINYQHNDTYKFFENFDDYSSHNIYLKTNYFLNKNKKLNPLYFTGSLIYSYEFITNKDSLWDAEEFGVTHYTKNNYDYHRTLFGFAVGFGLCFDISERFGFRNEVSFSTKFAPFDKGYKEFTIDVSIAPSFKF